MIDQVYHMANFTHHLSHLFGWKEKLVEGTDILEMKLPLIMQLTYYFQIAMKSAYIILSVVVLVQLVF